MSTLERVQDIIIDFLCFDECAVTESASLRDDLCLDSLDAVELLMSLEDEFATELEIENIDEIKTVGDLAAFVERNKP